MDEKKKTPKVKSLSNLFAFVLVVILACIGYVLFTAFRDLPPYALEVNKNLKQANLISDSGNKVSTSTLSARAGIFFTTPEDFPVQVAKDVKKYASSTGVSTPGLSTRIDNTQPNKQFADIIITEGVTYTNLVSFIKALEGNVPKITIEELDIKQVGSNETDLINIEKLTISMGVR